MQTPAAALVTAGPTEEPIDSVRFIGNRSSGQMGIAIAEALLSRGFEVVLAAGPLRNPLPAALTSHPRLRIERFRTSHDLERLLRRELPQADLVVMAAAVADFRPRQTSAGKLRRSEGGIGLDLDAVPDLLQSTRDCRKPGGTVVGFALEPAERLAESAKAKLSRKDLAAIVANPLETMEAPDIEGTLFLRDGSVDAPGGRMGKREFAAWLVDRLIAVSAR